MARYKLVDLSPRLLPVDLNAQLVPGSYAYALHHVIDGLDLGASDAHPKLGSEYILRAIPQGIWQPA